MRVWFARVAAVGLLVALATAARADLEAECRQVISAADLRKTQVSVLVVDAATGEELVSINPDEPMMPASNMKLVTTAAALKVLGGDFVFKTDLRLVDSTDGRGGKSLVVVGDGDPGFGDPELLKLHNLDVEQMLGVWVSAVKNAGVASIDRLVIDDRVFDRQWTHPAWPEEQLSSWYCAQVAGLNFYDNCLDIIPDPTSPGAAPKVRIMPAAPFLNTTNKAVTGKQDTFWVSRRLGSNDLIFRGEVKTRRTQALNTTIDDPPLLFGRILADRLAAAGVKVGRVVRPEMDERLPEGSTLHSIQTTLPLVLQRCNKDSQNLFAEALIKRIARQATGQPGGWGSGASTVRAFLADQIGPAASAVSVSDGSGMSRHNRVTARVLVGLLRTMNADPKLGPLYRQSLSVGGGDGTLQKRFKGLAGQVLGKSGYINGVSTLSGYLVVPTSAGTRTLAFSCLFNDFKPPVFPHQVKAVQDQLVQVIDKRTATPVRSGHGG